MNRHDRRIKMSNQEGVQSWAVKAQTLFSRLFSLTRHIHPSSGWLHWLLSSSSCGRCCLSTTTKRMEPREKDDARSDQDRGARAKDGAHPPKSRGHRADPMRADHPVPVVERQKPAPPPQISGRTDGGSVRGWTTGSLYVLYPSRRITLTSTRAISNEPPLTH